MIATAFLFVLVAVASVNSKAQFLGYPQYPQFYDARYFGNPSADSLPAPTVDQDGRLFFGGALLNAFRPTLTLATSTTTSTVTISSTCTTSTAALTTCSPAGRRRRGLLLNKKRSLFYAEDEHDADADNVFLPIKAEETKPAAEEESVREARSASPNLVPFIVQPGFNAPEELRGARQLISIATRTVTTTTTTTTTAKLTAVCLSSTGFPAC